MQNGKSRIKRVASAVIAGVMALQTVAPVISYADDTASSVATTDDSDAIANVDPGTPVQVDATASEEPSDAPSSGASQADENSEETETNSDITDEVANEHTDADTADETQTVEEDAPKQDESTSETTDTAPSRTVTVTLNKNGGEFEPEWLETANEDPIAAYLGTETNDIVVEDTGDTIVATVTDRDSIDIPVALSSDESLYFTGWDVSSGSYNADSETLTFEDGVDAYVLSAVYSSVVDDDQTLVENRTEFDEQTKRQAIQERLKSSGISTYVLRPSDSYNQLDLVVEGLAFTSDDGLTQTFTAPYDGDYIITAYGANGGTGKGKYQGYRTPGRGGKAEGTVHLNAGQTIHIYLGEAGGYWSTNRTFGGGGGQIDWDRAWFPDEDNGQTDRYHVFGRGGGATYVTVDAWTMDQAGEAAHDYTDAEKAQNDAAAEVAKKHVILLAGGGGGMGESGGSAGGGGLEGQGPVANRYYAPSTIRGTFKKMSFTGVSKTKVPTFRSTAKFVGAFADENRVLTEEEKGLVPQIGEEYILPKEVVTICHLVAKTRGTKRPMTNIMLRGDPSVGKTAGARAIAAGLGLPYTFITCNAGTEIYNFIGEMMPVDSSNSADSINEELFKDLPTATDISMDPAAAYEVITGTPKPDATEVECMTEMFRKQLKLCADACSNGFKYVESPLVRAIRNGWVCELQEPSLITRPSVMPGLNGLLDETGCVVLPTGEMLHRHPDCIIISTLNIDLEGCRPLNQSFIDRHHIIMDMTAPTDAAIEARIRGMTGCDDTVPLRTMITCMKQVAKTCERNGATDGNINSMRSLANWVQAGSLTGDYSKAAEWTIVSGATTDPDTRKQLLQDVANYQF